MARKAETIFVQIASYRDPDLLNTLKDILDNAKDPKNLRFGIAWQHTDEDEWDNLNEYLEDERFRILDIPYEDSEGACWARNLLQQLYEDETYTLQIDSHTWLWITNIKLASRGRFWSNQNRKSRQNINTTMMWPPVLVSCRNTGLKKRSSSTSNKAMQFWPVIHLNMKLQPRHLWGYWDQLT